MNRTKEIKRKKLYASKDINQFMADYYYELDHAAKTGDKKIAWCTSMGPAELLRAMGFLVYFPETHSAMIGTSRMATELIPDANAIGYSPGICSYLTADIGAFLNHITPLQKTFKGINNIPTPDVLVFNTNQCRDVQDWFEWYGNHFNAPVIGINTHRGIKNILDNQIDSVASQIEQLIPVLEETSGTRFDLDYFKHTIALSKECSRLWKIVLDFASANPSPLTFFDGTTLMGPAVVGRGTQKAIDVYQDKLIPELKERVHNGIGAVDNERHRIFWDGMPVWGRLRAHSELFAGLNASVLASTYCNSWIFTAFGFEDPFRSTAQAYTELFSVRSDGPKENQIKEWIDFFKIDGLVFHDSRTCPTNSNSRYGMPQRLEKETGIPCLTIDGDLNDLRCISDEQTKTNIEAFIEQLEENHL